MPGCDGDLHCCGLCFRHERCWGKDRTEPIAVFIARARALTRAADMPGRRLRPGKHRPARVVPFPRPAATAAGHCSAVTSWRPGWPASGPGSGCTSSRLAGLPELLRVELLYGLQHRDQAPPPLDPTEVRILLARLGDAASLREADPQVVCESGGMVYNAGTRGLFRDLRRHLDRAWAQHTGLDPFAGDVWQVALLDLRINASRRWPATRGVLDFRPHRTGRGCARSSRTGPAPPGPTCSGCARPYAPARPPPTR